MEKISVDRHGPQANRLTKITLRTSQVYDRATFFLLSAPKAKNSLGNNPE